MDNLISANKKLFILIIAAAIGYVILSLHTAALKNFLYWKIWWLDIPLHFLGGLVLGLLSVWAYLEFGKNKTGRIINEEIFAVMLMVFLGGLFWEIFEFNYGITYVVWGTYWFDTIKDMCMDLLGGGMILFIYNSLIKTDYEPV